MFPYICAQYFNLSVVQKSKNPLHLLFPCCHWCCHDESCSNSILRQSLKSTQADFCFEVKLPRCWKTALLPFPFVQCWTLNFQSESSQSSWSQPFSNPFCLVFCFLFYYFPEEVNCIHRRSVNRFHDMWGYVHRYVKRSPLTGWLQMGDCKMLLVYFSLSEKASESQKLQV